MNKGLQPTLPYVTQSCILNLYCPKNRSHKIDIFKGTLESTVMIRMIWVKADLFQKMWNWQLVRGSEQRAVFLLSLVSPKAASTITIVSKLASTKLIFVKERDDTYDLGQGWSISKVWNWQLIKGSERRAAFLLLLVSPKAASSIFIVPKTGTTKLILLKER